MAYSDAAIGTKQIKLLGLSGTYVQMLTENYPNFRGVASPFGMDYIPGAWMEGIYISKGTSSVKNGYEALAGQINVEYKKPQSMDSSPVISAISHFTWERRTSLISVRRIPSWMPPTPAAATSTPPWCGDRYTVEVTFRSDRTDTLKLQKAFDKIKLAVAETRIEEQQKK